MSLDMQLPTGTVTFLFTDIEGSTPLWEAKPHAMKAAVARHHAILRQAIEASNGLVFQVVGDAFQAAFPLTYQALEAALEAQRLLQAESWGETGPLKVRMGLHTGPAELDERGEYAVSHTLNRAARVMSAGHGGQILLSQETSDLVERDLPEGASLKDLGEHRLKGMVRLEHIFQVVVPDLLSDFPPLSTSVEHPHNLPIRLTSFIGRGAEIEAVCDLLLRTEARLLTITGVGGTGKTSLAQQAGWKLLDHFKDGVFFVDLTIIQDPGLLITVIAQSLSIHELPGRSLKDVLSEHLTNRKLLLIIDNFEHVIAAGQGLVGILQSAPQLKILVTSREPLHISPERQYPLSPLPLPDPHEALASLQEYEAIRLFVERAQAIRSDFHLTAENGADIAEICRQLDGLPLAIELIVARLRLFTPRQLLQQVTERLRLLSGGLRDQPTRHQTMRSAIAWSYDLLSEDEQRLFSRLSVFPGSFTLEAAAAVGGEDRIDVISGMESLLDKNLVNRRDHPAGPRFWLFETLREYALDRLETRGERDETKRHHAVYYAQLYSTGPGQNYPLWDLERHNLRVAFHWAIENQDAGLVYKMGANFFAWEKQTTEGLRLITRSLSLPNTQAHTSQRGDLLYSAIALALFSRDYPAASKSLDEFGAIGRETGDDYRIFLHTFQSSVLFAGLGDYEGAINLAKEYLRYCKKKDDNFGIAFSNLQLGIYTFQLHQLPLAKAYLDEAQDTLSRLAEILKPYLVDCLSIRGYIALEENMPTSAQEHFRHAFQLALERSVEERAGSIYMGLGAAAMQTGNLILAGTWMSLAETIKRTTGFVSRLVIDNVQERYLNELKTRLTPADFNSIWEAGQVLTMEQAIAYGKERLLTIEA